MGSVMLFQEYVEDYRRAKAICDDVKNKFDSYRLEASDFNFDVYNQLFTSYKNAFEDFRMMGCVLARFVNDNFDRISFDSEPVF